MVDVCVSVCVFGIPMIPAKRTNQLDSRLAWDQGTICIRRGAHWRHLAMTIEQPVRGGDAALFQITLITCLHWRFIGAEACVSQLLLQLSHGGRIISP